MSTSKTAETILRTARLVLRGPRADDLDALHAIYGDARAMRYWSTIPDPDPARTKERLDRMIAAFADRPTYFVIERDDTPIGTAGCRNVDGEVGFILHPDRWRQGIGRETMTALIPHLFAVTDHDRLTADADPLNAASVGLLMSLGFHETHRAANTYLIDGIWSDSVYFALARP